MVRGITLSVSKHLKMSSVRHDMEWGRCQREARESRSSHPNYRRKAWCCMPSLA